jgi:hypothetical protein
MRIDHEVNIGRCKSSSCQALGHIWIRAHGLPGRNMCLNGWGILLDVLAQAQVEDDASGFPSIRIAVLNEKCQGRDAFPRVVGYGMNELVFWQSKMAT